MNYNPIPDLIILGLLLIGLGLMIRYTRPQRGATPGNVKRHQARRAAYMAQNGGYYLRERKITDLRHSK